MKKLAKEIVFHITISGVLEFSGLFHFLEKIIVFG